MYRAIDVAKYIVTKCVQDSHPISNLQLQKILYYVQKEYIDKGDLLFSDRIEAWQFGPVVRDVYYKFCGFGAKTIVFVYEDIFIDENDKNNIDPIIENKRDKDPWELVEETHRDGGAWAQVYQNGSGNRKEIPVELIRKAG